MNLCNLQTLKQIQKMANKNSVFFDYPGSKELLEEYKKQVENKVPDINGHIHTPHSFSAFSEIKQAFEMAKAEGISVLGINDFYTTDGYDEFAELAVKNKIFPLFNIEFMGLQNDLQEAVVIQQEWLLILQGCKGQMTVETILL